MNNSKVSLGVNIDHIATIRQVRYSDHRYSKYNKIIEPDLLVFALIAEDAGADSITVHLREDRRHVQDSDIWRLHQSIKTRLNLEIACTTEMIAIAKQLKPTTICFVPEKRKEITTEGGFDIFNNKMLVKEVISSMKEIGIQTSIFIDPEPKQVEAAHFVKTSIIELHTGAFANQFYSHNANIELNKLKEAAIKANKLGIKINAGHGINYKNVQRILEIPHLNELNIGHSIISRSLYKGLKEAVYEIKKQII